ncbi:MAG: restriction endonuclease subunit S [Niabella sp.]
MAISHYENLPFEIPDNWVWYRLDDICAFENGYAFSSNEYKSEGIPLIRISNIKNGDIDLSDCTYIEESENIDDKFHIQKGDLLIAMSGATTGKMGIYNFSDLAYLNQRVGNIKIRNREVLFDKYRNFFMLVHSNEILKMAHGGAQPNISSKIMAQIFFPLPPYEEQKRIVNEITKLFSALDTIAESL